MTTTENYQVPSSPADPTPPDHFGRYAGLFGAIALGAGVITWHVL